MQQNNELAQTISELKNLLPLDFVFAHVKQSDEYSKFEGSLKINYLYRNINQRIDHGLRTPKGTQPEFHGRLSLYKNCTSWVSKLASELKKDNPDLEVVIEELKLAIVWLENFMTQTPEIIIALERFLALARSIEIAKNIIDSKDNILERIDNQTSYLQEKKIALEGSLERLKALTKYNAKSPSILQHDSPLFSQRAKQDTIEREDSKNLTL